MLREREFTCNRMTQPRNFIVYIITVFTIFKKGQGISFTSPDVISGNDTFLLGSKATLDCRTSEVPINVILWFNKTQAANCLDDYCATNPSMEVYYNITTNKTIGQINVHTDPVTASFGYTAFTCEAERTNRTITPKIKDNNQPSTTKPSTKSSSVPFVVNIWSLTMILICNVMGLTGYIH